MSKDTFFAPAARLDQEQVSSQIREVLGSPVTDGILRAADCLVAILNEQRQVISVNEQLLRWLGIEDAGTLLGLRIGDMVGCENAAKGPSGCGTTPWCVSCGQAIATVAALRSDVAQERHCVIHANRDGATADLYLSVRASPFQMGEHRYIALLLRDISEAQRLAASERLLLHDLGNLLNAVQIVPMTRADDQTADTARWSDTLNRMLGGLTRMFRLHRALVNASLSDYTAEYSDIEFNQIMADVCAVAERHPAARGKKLVLSSAPPCSLVRTDYPAASRVLLNMLINAFEATDAEGEVRVRTTDCGSHIEIAVWNAKAIPPQLALRIFQRNFSTRGEAGRGLGTAAMKALGETLLGGEVHFSSDQSQGTTFVFRLPVKPSDPDASGCKL